MGIVLTINEGRKEGRKELFLRVSAEVDPKRHDHIGNSRDTR